MQQKSGYVIKIIGVSDLVFGAINSVQTLTAKKINLYNWPGPFHFKTCFYFNCK